MPAHDVEMPSRCNYLMRVLVYLLVCVGLTIYVYSEFLFSNCMHSVLSQEGFQEVRGEHQGNHRLVTHAKSHWYLSIPCESLSPKAIWRHNDETFRNMLKCHSAFVIWFVGVAIFKLRTEVSIYTHPSINTHAKKDMSSCLLHMNLVIEHTRVQSILQVWE